MIRSVFISRPLPEGSPLRLLCRQAEATLVARSLLRFDRVPIKSLPKGDWLFFTSPRAVNYLAESIPVRQWEGFQIGAIGPGTAHALLQLGVSVDFTGNGAPEPTANHLAEFLQGGIVVFPQAQHSRRSIQSHLPSEIQTLDLVVYNNQTNPSFIRPSPELAILTSPLNLRAFLERNDPATVKIWIAMGQTTQNAMEEHGLAPVYTPQSPNEAAIAQLISEKGWLKIRRKP
jgi:uroporphyrinogen-III synthase